MPVKEANGMNISFTVTKSEKNLKRQWGYLIKRGFINNLYSIKKFFALLLSLTLLYCLFNIVTPVNDFITMKVISFVLITFGWCIIILIFLLFVFGHVRSRLRLKTLLNFLATAPSTYDVKIDEDKVSVISENNTTEFPWTTFSCFGIHNETLYIVNKSSSIDSLFWDRSEITSETFSALIGILKQKSVEQAF